MLPCFSLVWLSRWYLLLNSLWQWLHFSGFPCLRLKCFVKFPFLPVLYGHCGHWWNSVGSPYSLGWLFIEHLDMYFILHDPQYVLRLCTSAIWFESTAKGDFFKYRKTLWPSVYLLMCQNGTRYPPGTRLPCKNLFSPKELFDTYRGSFVCECTKYPFLNRLWRIWSRTNSVPGHLVPNNSVLLVKRSPTNSVPSQFGPPKFGPPRQTVPSQFGPQYSV